MAERRNVSQVLATMPKDGHPSGGVVIDAGMAPTAIVEGRGFWRDGQAPAAFLSEAVAIFTQRTGHAPAVAYCHPGQAAELRGHGVEVRPAPGLNVRMMILAGVQDEKL